MLESRKILSSLDRGNQPKLAFISCGRQSFGHPAYEVIERLLNTESSIQHVYLTNFIHNRKGVNPKYDDTARDLLMRYHELIRQLKADAELPEAYGERYNADLQALSEENPKSTLHRLVNAARTRCRSSPASRERRMRDGGGW
jgi:hypothetical protein